MPVVTLPVLPLVALDAVGVRVIPVLGEPLAEEPLPPGCHTYAQSTSMVIPLAGTYATLLLPTVLLITRYMGPVLVTLAEPIETPS